MEIQKIVNSYLELDFRSDFETIQRFILFVRMRSPKLCQRIFIISRLIYNEVIVTVYDASIGDSDLNSLRCKPPHSKVSETRK